MKWRTDEPVSQVFTMSWISKLKQMTIKTKPKSAKTKQKSAPHSSLPINTFRSRQFGNGSFDAIGSNRNLSFSPEILYNSARREESDDEHSMGSFEVEEGNGFSATARYELESEGEFELSSSIEEEVDCELLKSQIFSDMISNIRKARDLSPELEEIMSDIKGSEESIEAEERIIADQKLRDYHQRRKEIRMISHSDYGSTKPVQKTLNQVSGRTAPIIKAESLRLTALDSSSGGTEEYGGSSSSSISLKSRKPRWRIRDGDPDFATLDTRTPERRISDADRHDNTMSLNLEKKSKKDQTVKELCSGSRKTKQRTKVRASSPKIASRINMCKMRALEDLKRTREHKKMGANEGRDLKLESFAVVKSSFNPQNDFRDSMVEMILENRIGQPEELESLLACYLSLNSSEYHDIIIEVFRKVWCDLNGDFFPKRILSSMDSSTPHW